MLWDIIYFITGLDSSRFNRGLYIAALTGVLFFGITFVGNYVPFVNTLALEYPTVWVVFVLAIAVMRAFSMSESYMIGGIPGRDYA